VVDQVMVLLQSRGRWREALFMASTLGAPVALLSDIPNRPLFGGLVEDGPLAHTFVQFLTT
jgi:PhoPQ-activated pathogenicity-related protein